MARRAEVLEVEYHSYRWPQLQLALWLGGMFLCSIIVLGVFAQFLHVQNYLGRGRPWYFDMSLAVAIISLIFVIIGITLFNIRMLTPYYMFGFACLLFVLWLISLIGVGIGLFGNQIDTCGSNYCSYWSLFGTQQIIQSNPGSAPAPIQGGTVTTTTQLITTAAAPGLLSKFFWGQLCASFKVGFVFELFAVMLLTYMIFQSYDVYREDRMVRREIEVAD